ncbi:Rieske (2Fe-2S) protein [Kribbella sp. NPDC026611]|uniref:Rieske (2Fe-2S) protein n=1 Tax=Kribbella sp. NPDC026611 TaxID=3154911 RepID=UPI0033D05CD7
MSDDTMAPTTPQQAPEAGPELRDRRSVLRCAALVALVGGSAPLLAACGGGDDTGAGGTSSSAPGTSTSTASSPSAPASSAPSSSAPASSAPAGGGKVLGPVSDVPVGGGKVFADAKVVVTQPTAGQYKGFSAICTHQGNPVGSVENGQIVCPFHGSRFKITDGSVANGPASAPLPAVKVAVQGSNIVQSA